MSPVCIVNGLFADIHITRKVGSGDLRQNFTRKIAINVSQNMRSKEK